MRMKIIHLKKNGDYVKPYPDLVWLTNTVEGDWSWLYENQHNNNNNYYFVCTPNPTSKYLADELVGFWGIVGVYKLNHYYRGVVNFSVL